MRKALMVAALSLSTVCAARAQTIAADWQGTLNVGSTQMRLVLHIVKGNDGSLTATMDSIEQGASGIPVSSISLQDRELKFALVSIHGSYDGKVNSDGTEIDGTWSQGVQSLPLVLRLSKDSTELEPPRPQNPLKPYPYREEEISYENKPAGIRLAATLTIPPGKGPFPAVLLIGGSGANNRDEAVMGHRPFLVLSDYLTRRGIVVLRADKRGIGKSEGTIATATMADFATDAEAGVTYLKTIPEIDSHRIGLVGHSEGGIIASMVAAHDPVVAFIVMMAGPGIRGDEIVVAQTLLISEASGQNREQAEMNAAEEREILTLIEQETNDAILGQKLRLLLAGKIPEAALDAEVKTLSSPWYRGFISYDPATSLRKVTCPVLALIGEKDLQVPPGQNIPAIREALDAAGNKSFEVDELKGLNHLFQDAKTGMPTEYARIEETMSPVALQKIASWILQR